MFWVPPRYTGAIIVLSAIRQQRRKPPPGEPDGGRFLRPSARLMVLRLCYPFARTDAVGPVFHGISVSPTTALTVRTRAVDSPRGIMRAPFIRAGSSRRIDVSALVPLGFRRRHTATLLVSAEVVVDEQIVVQTPTAASGVFVGRGNHLAPRTRSCHRRS